MIRKICTLGLIIGVIASYTACSSDKGSPLSPKLEEANHPLTSIVDKSVLECPSSGHKFINFSTLKDVAAPEKATAKSEISHAVLEIAPYFIEIEGDRVEIAEAFPITTSNAKAACEIAVMSGAVTATTGDKKMLFIATGEDLKFGDVDAMAEAKECLFKSFEEVGGIKNVLFSQSLDFSSRSSVTEEAETVEGLQLSTSKSVNVLPPGVKQSQYSVDSADYIFILAANNWIGRVKPSMLEAGCVETILDPSSEEITSISFDKTGSVLKYVTASGEKTIQIK